MSRINIVVLTEGGKSIGFGHLSRSLALAQCFDQKKDCHIQFVVHGDESILDVIKGFPCDRMSWFEDSCESVVVDILQRAQIVVVDSYFANREALERLLNNVPQVIYIDDSARINYPRGIILNYQIYADSCEYGERALNDLWLGPQYVLLRNGFRYAPQSKIRSQIEKVLISFGGVDGRNMSPQVLKWLQIHYPNLMKVLVIGKGFRNIESLEAIKDGKTEFVYFPDDKKMYELMEDVDLAITTCGQILFELAYMGVPTVAMAVAENQKRNAHAWESNGFIQYAGFYTDEDLMDKLLEGMESFKNYDDRLRVHEIGRSLMDGKGHERLFLKLQDLIDERERQIHE